MTEKRERQIPESRIALNPVVVDDSKRGEPTRCPLDEHALVERLKEWELEAHNKRWKDKCKDCEYNLACTVDSTSKTDVCGKTGERVILKRVIDLIQNGRVRQQHRQLVPRGWSEVD